MEIDNSPGQSFPVWSRDGVPVVTAPAEIDFSNVVMFGSALVLAGTDCATIVVDMRGNVLCDSTGLAALIHAHKRAAADGGQVRLVMHPAQVPKVFKATGLDQIVKIYGTVDEALGSAQR